MSTLASNQCCQFCEEYEYCEGTCCGYGNCTCTVVVCPECGHRDYVTPADPTAHWQRLRIHRFREHGMTTTAQTIKDAGEST